MKEIHINMKGIRLSYPVTVHFGVITVEELQKKEYRNQDVNRARSFVVISFPQVLGFHMKSLKENKKRTFKYDSTLQRSNHYEQSLNIFK